MRPPQRPYARNESERGGGYSASIALRWPGIMRQGGGLTIRQDLFRLPLPSGVRIEATGKLAAGQE